MLDAHRFLGGQEQLVAIDRRGKPDALLADLAQGTERKNLKAAGIGKNRLVPAHEAMQTAMHRDHLQPRSQPQVKGIAQTDRCADFGQITWRHRLDRTVGADRHEDRRFDNTMGQRQAAKTGVFVGSKKFKVHF